jgi:2-polyprenyl-3-methyl-5-hydroxy-6-metoxy-1,4-benzoquinol methylase
MATKPGLLAFIVSNNHWALPDAFFWSYLRMFKPNGSVVVKGEASIKASSINDGLYKAVQMGAEWFFLMDVDQLFPQDTIPRRMETANRYEAGIVSVLYHVGRAPFAPVAGWAKKEGGALSFVNKEGLDWKENYTPLGKGVVEVDFAGAGGLLIRRPVLDAVGWPPFQDVWDPKVGRRIMGHDVNFCLRAKEKGFKTVVDTDVCSDHGKFNYVSREWAEAFHGSGMANAMLNSIQRQSFEAGYWDVLWQTEAIRKRERRLAYQETFMDVHKGLGTETGKIADVGCGPGTFLAFEKGLRQASYRGYDFSEEAIKAVREKGFDGEVADFRNYEPNGDRHKFDAAVSLHVIEHMKDEARFLKLLKDLVRPGGRVIIATPWAEEIQGHFEHVRGYTEESLGTALAKQFKDVRITKNSRDFVAVCTV